jgi:hypothetical protein
MTRHCPSCAINSDDDCAERIKRIGLGRRDCQSHRRFVRRQRNGVEIERCSGRELAAALSTHAAAPVRLPNVGRDSILFVLLHDKDQHCQDRQIKAKGRLLTIRLRRLPHLESLAANRHKSQRTRRESRDRRPRPPILWRG